MDDLKKMLMRGLESAVPGGAMAGATTRAVKSALKNIEKNKKMDDFEQLIIDGKMDRFIDEGVEPNKNVSKSLRPKIRPKSTSLRPKIRPKNIGSTDSPSTRGQDPKDVYSEQDLIKFLESAGLKYVPEASGMKRGGKVKKMKDGGLVGGQVKLDKNKDGQISGADFKMMENGGAVRKKKGKSKKSGGAVCRGAGAAIKGTRFSGVR
tara:strand:+ start:399 stop:1019 length:621 start_codon:yes stop_codon:yes gene_type:complete